MLLGCPSVGRANYVRFKLWRETHTLWIEIKCSLGLKIDGVLAFCLLNTTVTGLNRRNSMKVNYLNQSELVHFSDNVRF